MLRIVAPFSLRGGLLVLALSALLLALSATCSGEGVHRKDGVELAVRSGDLVAVVGDSITEMRQYSVFLEDYLLMCRPASRVRVAQFGWSGETAHGFKDRMVHDMLSFRPSVVTTCFGMNDGGYAPLTPERAAKYRAAQVEIVRACKAAGVREIVVGSPGCVDADTYHGDPAAGILYNRTLAGLRDLAREVALQEGVRFADIHTAMMEAMTAAKLERGPGYHVGGADGIHPAPNGHLCMAYAFLKAMGCTGDIARIVVDLDRGRVQASEGHRVLARDGGSLELESSRYPFCFQGDGETPDSPRSILDFLPFHGELNRFTLVVSGGTAGAFRVTWGDRSRLFSASQLASGVNLAEAFPDNPFSAPFQSVDGRVRFKQGYETGLVKGPVRALGGMGGAAEGPALERIDSRLRETRELMSAWASEPFRPVRHTLRIEPLG